jgi:hypothetical protein
MSKMNIASVSRGTFNSTVTKARGVSRIDPTTHDKHYTQEEKDYNVAVDEYMKKTGRRFMTNSEHLTVLRSIGFERIGFIA